jgi:thiol-disulfide isomerase/thioredoxin
MIAVTLSARFLLAAVLLLAGLAKLRDREDATEAAAGLGVPRAWAPAVAATLPWLEIGIAVLLVPAATATAASALALALLVAFTATVAIALARGRRPACRCFGALSDAPIGASTLVRNAFLVGLALVALMGQLTESVPDPAGRVAGLEGTALLALILGVVLAIVVVGGGFAAVELLRAYGRLLQRVELLEQRGGSAPAAQERGRFGLEPGSPAPAFQAPTLAGDPVSLDTLLESGRQLLLTFVSQNCGPCVSLLPKMRNWQAEYADSLSIAFVIRADDETARAFAAEHDLAPVLVDADGDVASAYQAHGTPAAVLVTPDGTIADWGAPGEEAIQELVAIALTPTPARVGAPIPQVTGVSLGGRSLPLGEVIEDTTVLLFWNPSCGYCRGMRDDVRRLEADPAPDGPQLVIVSVDADATRDEAFESPVVLDATGEITQAFGATGTPMAVLIDPDGRIGSEVAAGAEKVLALTRNGSRLGDRQVQAVAGSSPVAHP